MLGDFASYRPPIDSSSLPQMILARSNPDPSHSLLSELCLSLQRQETMESDERVVKSNVGGFHSRVYRFGGGHALAGQIEGILKPFLEDAVVQFHAVKKGQGRKMRQHKAVEWWVNVMDWGEGEDGGEDVLEDGGEMVSHEEFLNLTENICSLQEDGGSASSESSGSHHHALHDHTGATYSGCYYVVAGTKCPPLVLRSSCEGDACCYLPLPARERLCYIFPGWMPHAVPRGGGGKRISIAFNFYVGSGGGGYNAAT